MIAVPSAAVNRLSAVPPAALFFLPGHGTGRKKSSFGMIYILGQSCIKVENIWSESMLSDPQAYACGEISRCGRGRDAMTETIIIKPSVRKQFDSFMAHGRVLFFSAPCGFGKTVLADALLRGQKVLRLNAGAPAFLRVRITFCGCTRAEKTGIYIQANAFCFSAILLKPSRSLILHRSAVCPAGFFPGIFLLSECRINTCYPESYHPGYPVKAASVSGQSE